MIPQANITAWRAIASFQDCPESPFPAAFRKGWYSETARIAGDAHLRVGIDRSLWARRAGVRNSP